MREPDGGFDVNVVVTRALVVANSRGRQHSNADTTEIERGGQLRYVLIDVESVIVVRYLGVDDPAPWAKTAANDGRRGAEHWASWTPHEYVEFNVSFFS
jgi:hypothetical protein